MVEFHQVRPSRTESLTLISHQLIIPNEEQISDRKIVAEICHHLMHNICYNRGRVCKSLWQCQNLLVISVLLTVLCKMTNKTYLRICFVDSSLVYT